MASTLLFFAFLAVFITALFGLATEGWDWIGRVSRWWEAKK